MQIKIEKLNYYYEKKMKAIDSINFNVLRGEFIGITGHTGSGKSTLLKHLNAILKSSNGSVEILGRRITPKSKMLKEIRKNVGVVFQFPEDQLFSQTVKEDIMFGPKNFEIPIEETLESLEDIKIKLDLSDEILARPATTLSGGEKRRVSIASVVVSKPKILVLDEPTIGLDYGNKTKLLQLLRDINDSGVTIIIVSHDLHSTWDYLDRIVLLEGGKVVFDGNKESFLKDKINYTIKEKYYPDFIKILIKVNLLKNNEKLAGTKKQSLKIITDYLDGETNE